LVLLLLVLILVGGDILLIGLLIISLIGLYELYKVVSLEKELPGLLGYAVVILYYVGIKLIGFSQEADHLLFFVLLAVIILMMAIYVFSFPKYRAEQIMAAYFGILYVAFMLSCVYLIRQQPRGIYLVWLVFLCSWGCDTCAYCVGKLFGKHKMTPKLSPKKTIEGAIGGVIGSIILTTIFGFGFKDALMADTKYILFLAGVCGVGAFVSMIGDLAASAIKRNYDKKDYGNLIPGHGGILDRFDSVIFTAPVIYFLIMYIN
jgi:phosphatidate cytidylyltransferase